MNVPQKIEVTRKLFSEGKDAREVAKELGYKDVNSLSRMMKGRGYRWDPRSQNYVPTNGEAADGTDDVDMETIFKERGKELVALLDWFAEVKGTEGEPRMRRFQGPTVTKGFRLPIELDERLNEFCQRAVVHQKDVIITAIVEFLERHEGEG